MSGADRTPRYAGTGFKSYEEILRNIDHHDPFGDKSVSDKMEDETRIIKNPKEARVAPMRDDQHGHIGKRRKKRKSEKVKLTGVQNLSYNDHEEKHVRMDELGGRNSAGNMSTGTYVVDENKLDDSTDGMLFKKRYKRMDKGESSLRSSKTLKKLKIDSRVSMYYSKKGLNKGLVARYVSKFFKSRECQDYVQNPSEKNMCKCGRDIEWHVRAGIVVDVHNSDNPWFPDSNTRQVPCTSFGEISFCGFGRETSYNAPYIRVDAFETKYEDTLTLMTDYWNVPPPKLLIGVTGGAKQFHWKKRLLDTFKTGIINAAKSTSAWIITGGMDAGVMKNVGQAVQEHILSTGVGQSNIVAVGVATWGYIGNRKALVGEDGDGLFPAVYNAEDLPNQRLSPLNPGHTHFILVDDGTEGQFGKEIDFWAGFQNFISEKMETKIMQEQTVRVPGVLMVLEGGPNTLKTTASSIANDTPIVIIQGSGRCADFIAHGFKLTKPKSGSEEPNFPPEFDEEMTEIANHLFDTSKLKPVEAQRAIKRYVQTLRKILEDRKYITIFSLEDESTTNDIDVAILCALLKANQASASTQLSLALAWNRCDIARDQIFTAENRKQWQGLQLSEAFITALVQNRVDFVQLFLDMGVNLKRFLTVRRLRDVYEKVLQDEYSGTSRDLIKNLLSTMNVGIKYYIYCGDVYDELFADRRRLLFHVGQLLCCLLGYQIPNLYAGSEYEVDDTEATLRTMEDATYSLNTPRNLYRDFHEKTAGGNLIQMKDKLVFAYPERELLFWSILLNRRELAMLFWRLGQDHVGGALISSSLLKALSKDAEDAEEIDLANELSKHSQDFENLANGVLTEMYSKNKSLTHVALIRNMDHWGRVTCLTLADTGEHMDFMGHTACQTRLNKIWRGRMALYTSLIKIMLTLFFPPAVWWIKFSTRDSPIYELLDDEINKDRNTDGKVTNEERKQDVEEEIEVQSTSGQERSPKEIASNPGRRNLFTVSLTGRGNTLSIVSAIIYFYTAPVTKFLLTAFFYLFFMGIFSYFVMVDLKPLGHPNSPSVYEYITWIWVTSLIVEEIRQFAVRDTRSFRYKARAWYSNYWNRFDFILYALFLTAVVTRCVCTDQNFHIARSFYAVTVGMFYLRFMQVFYAHKDIGPKVIMIRRMMTDVFFFLCILAVFILAYGISTQTLLFPNAEPGGALFKSIFKAPYWQMYGELFLEKVEAEIDEDNSILKRKMDDAVCSFNESVWRGSNTIEQCPVHSELTPVLYAGYMILTNVLLLNLLIAMFSYTFQNVQENSDLVWRFYRHDLVYEYFDRPPLVAPLIIFSHLFRLGMYLIKKCRKSPRVNTAFGVHLSKDHNLQVSAFERAGMERHLVKFRHQDRDHIHTKVTNTHCKLEKVILDLEVIKEQITGPPKSNSEEELISPTLVNVLNSERSVSREDNERVSNRLSSLEDKVSQILELLGQGGRQPYSEHREYSHHEHREHGGDGGSEHPKPRRRSGRQDLNFPERAARPQSHVYPSQIPVASHSYGHPHHVDRGAPPPYHPHEQPDSYYHSMFEEPSVTITDVDSNC